MIVSSLLLALNDTHAHTGGLHYHDCREELWLECQNIPGTDDNESRVVRPKEGQTTLHIMIVGCQSDNIHEYIIS